MPPSAALVATWREACDARMAIELGVVVLAAERADAEQLAMLDGIVGELRLLTDDFPAYRAADVRLHLALARATGSMRLEQATTESQGEMSDLIAHIAHPPGVLRSSNTQHEAIVKAVRRGDGPAAAAAMAAHLQGTEHVLAGLLP